MTAIIDYGVGNLFSLMCSLEYIGGHAARALRIAAAIDAGNAGEVPSTKGLIV